jgi:hypothetical protein
MLLRSIYASSGGFGARFFSVLALAPMLEHRPAGRESNFLIRAFGKKLVLTGGI